MALSNEALKISGTPESAADLDQAARRSAASGRPAPSRRGRRSGPAGDPCRSATGPIFTGLGVPMLDSFRVLGSGRRAPDDPRIPARLRGDPSDRAPRSYQLRAVGGERSPRRPSPRRAGTSMLERRREDLDGPLGRVAAIGPLPDPADDPSASPMAGEAAAPGST